MPTIDFTTAIFAPLERCFDLSRSIDLHADQQSKNKEEAIAGVTSGLIGANEEVTWRARHFGVTQTLTSKITIFSPPTHFRDSMTQGAFARFDHDHFFETRADETLMRDVFDFDAPLGVLGYVANGLFLTRYMERLLQERAAAIKTVAESADWARYLSR